MISKEVQQVSTILCEFDANEVTIGIFASSLCWAMREMNMYCFDQEFEDAMDDVLDYLYFLSYEKDYDIGWVRLPIA